MPLLDGNHEKVVGFFHQERIRKVEMDRMDRIGVNGGRSRRNLYSTDRKVRESEIRVEAVIAPL